MWMKPPSKLWSFEHHGYPQGTLTIYRAKYSEGQSLALSANQIAWEYGRGCRLWTALVKNLKYVKVLSDCMIRLVRRSPRENQLAEDESDYREDLDLLVKGIKKIHGTWNQRLHEDIDGKNSMASIEECHKAFRDLMPITALWNLHQEIEIL